MGVSAGGRFKTDFVKGFFFFFFFLFLSLSLLSCVDGVEESERSESSLDRRLGGWAIGMLNDGRV
jgi:hypothetical protein